MRTGAPPLRFLGLVLGGWIGVRAVLILPEWMKEAVAVEQAQAPVLALTSPVVRDDQGNRVEVAELRYPDLDHSPDQVTVFLRPLAEARQASGPGPTAPPISSPASTIAPQLQAAASPLVMADLPAGSPGAIPASNARPAAVPGRLSLSSWAFFRRGGDQQLAAAGQLGGSQIGARASFRLSDRASASLRLSSPVDRSSGAEAGVGIEFQPLKSVPVRVLAERREAVGASGRSAFALLAHGGVSEQPLLGTLRLDAYAQAGLVGLRSRDAFVDGSAAVRLPVSERLSVGAGLWGAAQPGVSRLDLGPQVSYRLPIGRGARISADWRFRVAGNARPGSGLALTIATDF